MSAKVNLKKYLVVEGRWQFVPVLKVHGRPQPGVVLVKGEPKKGTPGTFYLEWRENGKRIQRPCGVSAREALDAWNERVRILDGSIDDPQVDDIPVPAELVSVHGACETFLEGIRATKAPATYEAYKNDLAWFRGNLDRTVAGKVGREDLLRLFGKGRDAGMAQATINRRLMIGLMALRNAGATVALRKGDWPSVPETDIAIYSPEQLNRFFVACDDRERLIFQVFLLTGFRARELATLRWKDIDLANRSLIVCARPEYEFKPKSYETRRVPVPSVLIEKLRQHAVSGALVFPTKPHPKRPHYGGGAPDAHHLELCKQIAHRADLNCGLCVTSKGECRKGPYCGEFWLHRWRHTFATQMLQSGVDIKSLQVLLGHKQIATTEKYLRVAELADLQPKIETSKLASYLSTVLVS